MSSWGLSKDIETKLPTTCFKFFLRAKRGLQLVSKPHFSHYFWRKISCYILLTDKISLVAVTSWDVGNILCIAIVNQVLAEINLIFQPNGFFYMKKLKIKTLISSEWAELLRWSKMTFSIMFEGLSLKQIFLLEGESPNLRVFWEIDILICVNIFRFG